VGAVAEARRRAGRFESEYEDVELVAAVGRVLRAADPANPAAVRTRRFDDARVLAGEPGCPSARQACSRLGLSWEKLKELALAEDGTRNIEITLGVAAGSPRTEHLTTRHAIFGLREIARRAGDAESPSRGRYDAVRLEVITDARRHGRAELWAELLPTSDQILTLFDSWDVALQAAGLPPRPTRFEAHNPETAAVRQQSNAMSGAEAIKWFVIANDEWPSRRVLKKFMREAKLTLAEMPGDFAKYLSEAAALLSAEGHPVPPKTVPPRGRGNKRTFKLPPDGAMPASASKVGPWQDEDACVDAVARWLVGPPKPPKQTRRAYGVFAAGKPDFPSPTAFEQHSGWSAVLEKARIRARGLRNPSS
jgi:hypothetical protein